jgi:hypothetical protein
MRESAVPSPCGRFCPLPMPTDLATLSRPVSSLCELAHRSSRHNRVLSCHEADGFILSRWLRVAAVRPLARERIATGLSYLAHHDPSIVGARGQSTGLSRPPNHCDEWPHCSRRDTKEKLAPRENERMRKDGPPISTVTHRLRVSTLSTPTVNSASGRSRAELSRQAAVIVSKWISARCSASHLCPVSLPESKQPIYSKTLGASFAHADEKPLPSVMAFWFAWYAFHPDTQVFRAP